MLLKKGQQDLNDKLLKTVDTPKNTFIDNPSRYFRLLRFIQRFDLTVDPVLLNYLQTKDYYNEFYVG